MKCLRGAKGFLPKGKRYLYSVFVYCLAIAAVIWSYISMLQIGSIFIVLFVLVAVSFAFFVVQLRRDVAESWGLNTPRAIRKILGGPRYPAGGVFRNIPTGIKILVVLSVLYTFINFFVSLAVMSGNELRAAGAGSRLILGHMLAFAALPLGYFSGVSKTEPIKQLDTERI